MMKKITFCIVATALFLLIMGDFWNAYARNNNQMKIYQEEIISQKEEILELEDTIIQLIDRLELFERTWGVIRGTDSTTIDELFHHIRVIRDIEKEYYEDYKYYRNGDILHADDCRV